MANRQVTIGTGSSTFGATVPSRGVPPRSSRLDGAPRIGKREITRPMRPLSHTRPMRPGTQEAHAPRRGMA